MSKLSLLSLSKKLQYFKSHLLSALLSNVIVKVERGNKSKSRNSIFIMHFFTFILRKKVEIKIISNTYVKIL